MIGSLRSLRPAFAVFAVILLVSGLYSFTRTKVYEPEAALEILDYRTFLRMFDEHPTGLIDRTVGSDSVLNMNKALDYAGSPELAARVAARLDTDDIAAVLAPYPKTRPAVRIACDRSSCATERCAPTG